MKLLKNLINKLRNRKDSDVYIDKDGVVRFAKVIKAGETYTIPVEYLSRIKSQTRLLK